MITIKAKATNNGTKTTLSGGTKRGVLVFLGVVRVMYMALDDEDKKIFVNAIHNLSGDPDNVFWH